MYTKEQLMNYPYFAEQFKTKEIDQITDSLTGIVSRKYILGFARSLIADNIPFTFVMLDLDNFKFINDNYGHRAGDGVLNGVSTALSEYLDGYGIAGRFGGDEILFINFRHLKYDDKKLFFNDLYNKNIILRRNYRLDDCSPFVTGTIGCATFPDDASDYDTLFSMIDKTLYRGKNKGRNCYIIYVAEKHKDIEIKKLGGHGLCTVMQSMVRQCEMVPGTDNKFHSMLPLLMEELRISDMYYTDSKNILHAVLNTEVNDEVPDIGKLMKDDIFCTNDIDELKNTTPLLCSALKSHEIETALIARIGYKNDTYGYLICAEPHSHRIWQEDECAIMYFLTKLVAMGICIDGDSFPE
jgi:diguanylate cyclase (GGDEF)-like protein